ncbi:MarR family transcriptional regulator [Parashewanella curva]|uniref:MarR family transcriptional regulator n=1 Tax=Parashewanella curva TaxID=2338552 RepID=A0A3L8PWF8_9GAMM|nr:MarR family transcriptional regulator [Parashewanella curva]RLV58392.1 MarR family transcriptional regulator [Parashewanella curva]
MQRQQSLGYLISHFNVELQKQMDMKLKRYQLDLKYWPVLFALWEKEGVTQTELSHRCDVANYTMTRFLDVLQEQGYIYRHQEQDNRRAFQVYLTDDAKALKQDVCTELERMYDEILSGLSSVEREAFYQILRKVNRLE